MPDQPSIVIIKEFQYRGNTEEFSNKYHFDGGDPADDAAWAAMWDALIAAEQPSQSQDVFHVAFLGYNAGNDHAVAGNRVAPGIGTLNGTFAPATGEDAVPGDVAAWMRWKTADRTSLGKPIYLRKYMHGVFTDATDADKLSPTQRALMLTFANDLADGTAFGGPKVCGPQGAVAGEAAVSLYLTTRTLKRRGKRPPP